MLISLYEILKKDKNIELMRKEVALYVGKLDKINNKKDKEKEKELSGKGSKKEFVSLKNIKKEEVSVKDIKKGQSEKENEFKEEKIKSIE